MEVYIGEIHMFAGNFAPAGWALCNGQSLSIADNELLFALIGTTFGGDGQTTFNLPDLRGRVPIHSSVNYSFGQAAGTEKVTLLTNHMPEHNHQVQASNMTGDQTNPDNHIWASSLNYYSSETADVTMLNTIVEATGGNQPHDNIMPSLAINFIISLQGLYPPSP